MQRTTTLAEADTTTPLTENETITLTETALTIHGDNAVLFHAVGIKTAWNKQVSGIIETGQLLLEAKKAMSGTGKWLKLFDRNIGDLPFGADTAQLLMRIARHPVLSNTELVRFLPPSWGTLAVLSKASSDQLEKWLADGTVNANTERKRAESLVSPKPAKAKRKKDIAVSGDTASDATGFPTLPGSNASNEVQQSVQQLYKLACDAKTDWTHVNFDMVRDLIEGLTRRLDNQADAASRDKEWLEAACPSATI